MSGAAKKAAKREEGGANASQLWPLLALDEAARPTRSPPDGAATLPSDVAERLLAQELRDGQTLRALRLVSRACRAAVDTRVRSLRVCLRGRKDSPYFWARLTRMEALDNMGTLDVCITEHSFDASLPLLTSTLGRLPRLQQVEILNPGVIAVTPARRGLVAALVRALPPSLEVLKVVGGDVGTGNWLIDASAALPALRAFTLSCGLYESNEEFAPLATAVCRAVERAGAWSSLQELTLPYLDPGAYAALAAATQLTGLRSLSVDNCCCDPGKWSAGKLEPLPPHLSEDNGLHLLAAAPWLRGLTKLQLGAPWHESYAPTDKLFTGLELPRLESLTVNEFVPDADADGGLPTGLASAKLPALTKLKFLLLAGEDGRIGKGVAAAPWYAGVSHLELKFGFIGEEDDEDEEGQAVQRALLLAPFRSLTSLVVQGVPLTRDIVAAIATAPALRRLRSLELADNYCGYDDRRATREDWQAFARAPFAELRELDLKDAWFFEEHEREVRGAPWIAQLTSVCLDPAKGWRRRRRG